MSSITRKSTTRIACCLMLLILEVARTDAQRPSYAGSRPTGGGQKDKYHSTTAGTTGGVNVTNRIGEASENTTNTIPFGVAQRPPIGLAVVVPQPQYVPLGSAIDASGAPQFTVDNRINGNDINNVRPRPGGFSNVPPQFRPVPQPAATVPAGTVALPLDAHGDHALIDYLNTVPLDQRPFWFLNYQAIEAQRNSTNPAFSGAVGSSGSFFGGK